MATDENPEFPLIRAAGGLVWRHTAGGRQLLLVHRPKLDDWALPKGKLEAGERWEDAARREVWEETGYAVQTERFAGICFYYHNSMPKVVLFWNMRLADGHPEQMPAFDSGGETDEVVWLSPDEALERLSYPLERRLVQGELEQAG